MAASSSLLSRRLALVTGSTSGIGLGIAVELVKRGHDIILHGLGGSEVVQSAVASCKEALPAGEEREFLHHGADLSDPSQISDMFQYIKQSSFRSPDILINNAGMQYVETVEKMPVDKWDQLIAVNLTSSFHTTRLSLPGMRERGWGRIVNISSVHGLVGSVDKAPYVASKHGLIGLTKVVALETAGCGVTCNAICPGWVLTSIVEAQIVARAQKDGTSIEEAKESALAEKMPSKQLVMPNEIGAMVGYLCSDEARQVTGSTITIDGGWTAV